MGGPAGGGLVVVGVGILPAGEELGIVEHCQVCEGDAVDAPCVLLGEAVGGAEQHRVLFCRDPTQLVDVWR